MVGEISGYYIDEDYKEVTIYYYKVDIAAAFTGLTADGSATATTTKLILGFDKDITGLSAEDINLYNGSTGASKGSLTRTDTGVYDLAIAGINMGGSVTVTVSKSGYTISGSPKTVTIYYYIGGVSITEGTGTSTDPFIVYNVETLQRIGKGTNDDEWTGNWSFSAYYRQIKDIDLSSVSNWTPIGSRTSAFNGSYDGDGHTINNLTIDNPKVNNQGLFGYMSNSKAVVKNLGIVNCNITGKDYVGSVVGEINIGMVQNCYVTGNVSGTGSYLGGLVGDGFDGWIKQCYATCNVSGNLTVGTVVGSWSVGGVVGRVSVNFLVQNCYATGNVSANSSVGGVAGRNIGKVENCYSTGDVSGGRFTGGVVGDTQVGSSTLKNCYSTGNVSGTDYVGGVLGLWDGSTTQNCAVENCYSTGNITGTKSVGGVVGQLPTGGTVKNCVALNPNISLGRRIAGSMGSQAGSLSNNYGFSDMTQANEPKTWTSSGTGQDGSSITSTNWSSSTWWTESARFDTAVWDVSGLSASNLPKLKNMPAGTQNPVVNN